MVFLMSEVYRFKVDLIGLPATGGGINTFHTIPGGPSNIPAARALIADFYDDIKAQLANTLTVRVQEEVEEFNVQTGGLVQVHVDPVVQQVTGTSSQGALPQASQGLVRWGTGEVVNGRRLNGKTYIAGLTNSAKTDGRVDGSVRTLLQNAANGLMDALQPTMSMVTWSRKNGVIHLVNSASVWSEFAVLRSRRD